MEKIISAKWYTYKELIVIGKIYGVSGRSLCDNTTFGKANGGYGCNVKNKIYEEVK